MFDNSCWLRSLAFFQKVYYTMPQSAVNKNWPKFVETLATIIRMTDSIANECLQVRFAFEITFLNYYKTIRETL